MSKGIDGLDELLGKLNNLKGIKQNTDSLLAGAFVIERGAKQRAPVLTGFLRSSITSAKVVGGAEVRVGADYGYVQEFGTSKMPAQPFIRPTIDEDSDKVVKAVADQLEKEIKREIGG